jgi:2-oxoglutarate dehydrogenase E2 component (dihydrolipoamide succinyltransferase)
MRSADLPRLSPLVPRLSPLVRRLTGDNGLDPGAIAGTGAYGRVTGRDVQAHLRSAGAGLPASRIGRITAERMTESPRPSGYVLSVVEVDFHNIDRVRRAEQQRWSARERFPLSRLPFICRAALDALREFPRLNAAVTAAGTVDEQRRVNLGIAADVDDLGHPVPVIEDADGRRLAALARDIYARSAVARSPRDLSPRDLLPRDLLPRDLLPRDLSPRAQSAWVTPGEIPAATFTITSEEAAGPVLTVPVIAAPQVAVLSAGAVLRRVVPVATGDGDGLAIHNVGNLAMSWDHRAVGGRYAARFLTALKRFLEDRDWAAQL